MTVHDLLGRQISILVDEPQFPGDHVVEVASEQLPSGVYFYRLSVGTIIATRKMVVLK